MTEAEFLDFARAAALRATRNIGRIGNLVCTQANAKGEPTLREPEMRTAFQQEAEEQGLFYGIEVPTRYTYRFTTKEGTKQRRALVDFALLGSASVTADRNVLVEFKQGQPNRILPTEDTPLDYPKITKDLHKLWAEPVRHGRCMFHICQAADSGTFSAIEAKYNAVTQNAISLAAETVGENPANAQDGILSDCWFLLLILVLHQRGSSTGSFLHAGTWQGSHWKFDKPEPLLSAAVGNAESSLSIPLLPFAPQSSHEPR